MAMITPDPTAPPPLPTASSLLTAAHTFRAFSDPSRLAILQHLALGEHRVVDLTLHLALAQSTVSQHLACLRECGLVTSRPQGRSSMFRLTQPEATMEVLAAGYRLLSLTGDTCVADDARSRPRPVTP